MKRLASFAWVAAFAATVHAQSTKPAVRDEITVTANRGLGAATDEATSIALITPAQLQAAPGLALDDALHTVAGFQLFRRTSSWTANPTSSGVSLRGLGSTAASRTLVVSDEVPANDAFGGWVHWNETPTLAMAGVELLRGGASDLYGSSAIGGVIDIVPRTATAPLLFDADAMGAQQNTAGGDALVSMASQRWGALLGAYSALSNGGYVTTAPAVRGTIDVPTNVANEAGRIEWRTPKFAHTATAFLRGNVLNEARVNGTPLQNNAARLWRYVAGVDAAASRTTIALRVFGSREGYRQSFSSVNAARSAETLTKLQRVPSDECGFAAQVSHTWKPTLLAAAGLDLRDVRATDAEKTPSTAITLSTSAHQRAVGGFADGLWQPHGWSFSASVRVDSFRTFDARQVASSTQALTPLPSLTEIVASPHLGVVRRFPHGVSLTANAFRAFRGPTLNELYRTSQVGQQLTLANNSLLAERATGTEAGVELASAKAGRIRAAYFWTEINRPISAVLLSQTATSQTLQRQNLGQIRSRGLMVEAQSNRWHALSAGMGYQFAVATVTAFNTSSVAQPNLLGKWLPEVPRQSTTAMLDYAPRWITLHAVASYQGREYDDALNQSLLHGYARFDVSAERMLPHGFSMYIGAQNLLDRSIDAGRTPLLTLAPPRLVQGGVRFHFAR